MKNNYLKTFKNKSILITGGTGSIGSEIVKKLIKYQPAQIRIYSRDETKQLFFQQELKKIPKPKTDIRFLIGDIRDRHRLDMACGKIDIVFHTAALKHVPFCEYNPFEAVKTNIYGTQNLIDMAIKNRIKKVIAISTDKAVNPNNVMGATKLMMEKMILSAHNYLGESDTKFCVVRFGNILNSSGSVIPLWKYQIENFKSISITDPKMLRFFITVENAVNLIFRAAGYMKGNEIFILKMTERKIIDMAKETIKKSAPGQKIKIRYIGKRSGEKITEQLFTEEEEKNLKKVQNMYVISTGNRT